MTIEYAEWLRGDVIAGATCCLRLANVQLHIAAVDLILAGPGILVRTLPCFNDLYQPPDLILTDCKGNAHA